MISRQITRRASTLPRGVQLMSTTRICLASGERIAPTNESRISPRTASTPAHPGYTPADTPVSSAHPSTMPGPSSSAKISGHTTQASTRPHPPHQGIHEMAKGAEIGGEGAVTPEEKNVKNWGPNSIPPEMNTSEGKRNPVLHGGSNEGGFDSKGNSKT